MSFRYIITDTFDGVLKGTNDRAIATEFAICEDYFVYDSETGNWMTSDDEIPVTEVVRVSE